MPATNTTILYHDQNYVHFVRTGNYPAEGGVYFARIILNELILIHISPSPFWREGYAR